MGAILHRAALRWGFLGGVVLLLVGSASLVYFQFVKVKMLPFDNKSEFQVIVDMPNGTTLEETARATAAQRRGGPRSLFERRTVGHIHDHLELALVVEGKHLDLDELEIDQRGGPNQQEHHAAEESPAQGRSMQD